MSSADNLFEHFGTTKCRAWSGSKLFDTLVFLEKKEKSWLWKKISADENKALGKATVLPAKTDSDVLFCLQSYQGFIIDISLVY